MNEPAASRTLVIEREMPHPPEKVWRALTQGPLIDAWLMMAAAGLLPDENAEGAAAAVLPTVIPAPGT